MLSLCRVQPILCKDSANEDKGKLVFALSSAVYLLQKYEKNEKKTLFYFTKRIASGSTVIR